MLSQEYLLRDIERVNEQLGVLKEQISQSFELSNFISVTDRRDPFLNERAREFRRTSVEQVNRAQECLSQLKAKAKGRNGHDASRYCIFFLISLQSLETEVEEFQVYLGAVQPILLQTQPRVISQTSPQPSNPLKSTASWIRNTLMPRLERIMRGAWQIIANLLNPTKVSLKGDARTGIFGRTNVGLEIIFESEEPESPFSAIELPADLPLRKTAAVLIGEGED
ncbi:MAG: hypothetical protein PHV74_09775 [Dehalococcoidia bacterium]|nr:hypothetical protein [Dehalococcoidia bacterium]